MVATVITRMLVACLLAVHVQGFDWTMDYKRCRSDKIRKGENPLSCIPRCSVCGLALTRTSGSGACRDPTERKIKGCKKGQFAPPGPGFVPPEDPDGLSQDERATYSLDSNVFPSVFTGDEVSEDSLDSIDLAVLSECSDEADRPIKLYQHFNYGGRVCGLAFDTPRIDASFNDITSGAVVTESTWIVYEHFDFQGAASILKPGAYPLPTAMGFPNDRLSSVRWLPEPSAASILLFQDYDFRGRMVHVTAATDDFWDIAFNDLASSAIVLSGTWRLHQHVNFGGASYVLAEGEHRHLPRNDDLSSLQPL